MSKNYRSDQERIDAAWNKLEPMLTDDVNVRMKPSFFNKRLIAAAAAVVLITVAGVLFLKSHYREVTYATNYGETLKVTLPDSSVVFMNGNTELSFRKNWPVTGDREVLIEGEAYFTIKHTASNQKFFVRMNDHSSVEVLGTEFNVSKRGSDTRVVLNSGKIRFNMDDEQDSKQESLIMKPGDYVEYRSDSKTLVKKIVNPEIHSSWKTSRLVFDKTTLRDITRIIQDTYGMHVKVKQPELLNMKVSGSAPSQNIDMLIEGLSEIFELDLKRQGDTLIVSSSKIHQ